MSRRDTIIVAVLINTGLLAVLFMMAIHTEDPKPARAVNAPIEVVQSEPIDEYPQQQVIQPLPEPVKKPVSQVASHDELDQVLKNYATSNQPPTAAVVVAPAPKEVPKPAVAQVPETKPQEKNVEVTVKRGDSLDKLARANGTTIQAIMHANNLTSARIDIGQVLLVPVGQKRAAAKTTTPKKVAPQKSESLVADNEPQYYTLKSGDNPWKIAKQFHVKFDELLKMNGLNEDKARNLRPGDVLRVQ